MRLSIILSIVSLVAILLFCAFQEANCSAKRGGGRGRSSGSRSSGRSSSRSRISGSSSWGRSSSRSNGIRPIVGGRSKSVASSSNVHRSSFSAKKFKIPKLKKSKSSKSFSAKKLSKKAKKFLKKNLKYAILLGGGAYLTSKASKKLRKKFKTRKMFTNSFDYDFDDWESWREIDGMLCRDDNDCNWLDYNLGCNYDEFQLGYTTEADWPWKNDLKGRCACSFGLQFDAEHTVCRENNFVLGMKAFFT